MILNLLLTSFTKQPVFIFQMTVVIREVRGNLFQTTESMCHCISSDFRLGRGIARVFRRKFPRIMELKTLNIGRGGFVYLPVGGNFVYNLITKDRFFEKPSYVDLRKSLEAMKIHVISRGVGRISLPRIGCGLDRLEWYIVKQILYEVFHDCNLVLTVYF